MAGSAELSLAPEPALVYAPKRLVPGALLSGTEKRSSAAVGMGLPRPGLLGFVRGHEGQGGDLAFCNSGGHFCLPQTWKKT